MKLLINLIIRILAVLLSAYLVHGVTVAGFFPALVFAVVLGAFNFFLRPFLLLLTLPINILTMGLFTLVVNALLIMLAGSVVPGLVVASFWSALIFGVVLAVVNALMGTFLKGN